LACRASLSATALSTAAWIRRSISALEETAEMVVGTVSLTIVAGRLSANTITAIQGAAQESVDNISALLHTTIDFPIKVLVYSNARDLQQALSPGS
jgi:hypothetical protein